MIAPPAPPPACGGGCVRVGFAATGVAACDEANGALAGLYTFAGTVGGAPRWHGPGELYRPTPDTWSLRPHAGAGGAASHATLRVMVDDDGTPDDGDDYIGGGGVPLGSALWQVHCQGYASALAVELSCSACAPPPPPAHPLAGNLSSCALLEEVQYMAGSHVDLLSFVANDAGGGGRARVGAAGGEGGWPFALAPGEYITRISGRTGCGYLACWMLFETSTGATKSIGTYDGLAEGGAVFELSPPPGAASSASHATRRRSICPSRSAPSGTTRCT